MYIETLKQPMGSRQTISWVKGKGKGKNMKIHKKILEFCVFNKGLAIHGSLVFFLFFRKGAWIHGKLGHLTAGA